MKIRIDRILLIMIIDTFIKNVEIEFSNKLENI